MTLNDWRLVFEGAVAVVAVLAFLLSLANLYYTWWSSQPRVRVTMTAAVPLIGGTFRDPLFLITAANVGRVPVTLTSVGMDLAAKGETAVFLRPPLYAPPLKHTLEPG